MLSITSTLKLNVTPTDTQIDSVCAGFRENIAKITSGTPKITIIIPGYNEEMYLLAAINSISNLQTNFPLEFIGVDNGSNDRTGYIFEKSGFRVLREHTKGVSYARQAGLLAARGEIVFTTDADTLVPPNWINGSLGYFNKDKTLGLLSGGVRSEYLGASRLHGSMRKGAKILRKMAGKDDKINRFFPGANSVFKKEIALSVGGYDLGSDRGEDNILAEKIGKVSGLLKIDDDPTIQVITSGRRLSTLTLLLKMFSEKALDVLRKDENTRRGRTFTDVR